jgi:hypothetical protein
LAGVTEWEEDSICQNKERQCSGNLSREFRKPTTLFQLIEIRRKEKGSNNQSILILAHTNIVHLEENGELSNQIAFAWYSPTERYDTVANADWHLQELRRLIDLIEFNIDQYLNCGKQEEEKE